MHRSSDVVRHHGGIALAALIASMLAACSSAPIAPATPVPRNAEPPAPSVNLSGFPLPYRQGYADGCASAKGAARKDNDRFANDGNYSMGWQDGLAMCRRR